MFGSLKLKNPRAVLFPLICAVILAAVCLFALRSTGSDTLTINGERYSPRAADDEDIRAFFNVCGVDEGELLYERDIIIPKRDDEAFSAYLDLQREQGFDLAPYKGKSAVERCYILPDGGTATLLLSDGRIIAAHMSSDGIYPIATP